MSLVDQNMVPFRQAYPMVVFLVLDVLAGNTAFVSYTIPERAVTYVAFPAHIVSIIVLPECMVSHSFVAGAASAS